MQTGVEICGFCKVVAIVIIELIGRMCVDVDVWVCVVAVAVPTPSMYV